MIVHRLPGQVWIDESGYRLWFGDGGYLTFSNEISVIVSRTHGAGARDLLAEDIPKNWVIV